MAPGEGFSKADILDGKMYAVLAYLSIFCIIPLIFKKKNAFVAKRLILKYVRKYIRRQRI